jgi:hypothetical protein
MVARVCGQSNITPRLTKNPPVKAGSFVVVNQPTPPIRPRVSQSTSLPPRESGNSHSAFGGNAIGGRSTGGQAGRRARALRSHPPPGRDRAEGEGEVKTHGHTNSAECYGDAGWYDVQRNLLRSGFDGSCLAPRRCGSMDGRRRIAVRVGARTWGYGLEPAYAQPRRTQKVPRLDAKTCYHL